MNGRYKQIIPWTKELEQRICELWKTCTTEGIAEIIGFPGHRSAVMGKLKRLGAVSPKRRGSGNKSRKAKSVVTGKQSLPGDRPKSFDRAPKANAARPKATKAPIPLAKLKPGQCKWPMWPDGARPVYEDMLFCGETSLPASVWCSHHADVAFTPGRSQKARLPAAPPESRTPSTQRREKLAGRLALAKTEESPLAQQPEQSDAPRGLSLPD